MAHTPAPDFADYGLALPRLFVTAIAKPGGGSPQCERSRELHFRKYEDREGEFDCESV